MIKSLLSSIDEALVVLSAARLIGGQAALAPGIKEFDMEKAQQHLTNGLSASFVETLTSHFAWFTTESEASGRNVVRTEVAMLSRADMDTLRDALLKIREAMQPEVDISLPQSH